MAGLTAKQEAFCREYLIDLNATQAAIRAGYSKKTAEWQGPQLLTKTHVSAAIQEGIKKRSDRTETTADMVVAQLVRFSFSDIRKIFNESGSLKSIHDLPDDVAAAVMSIEVVEKLGGLDAEGNRQVEYVHKIRLVDKVKPIELLGKHLGMWAEKREGPQDGVADLLAEVIARMPR